MGRNDGNSVATDCGDTGNMDMGRYYQHNESTNLCITGELFVGRDDKFSHPTDSSESWGLYVVRNEFNDQRFACNDQQHARCLYLGRNDIGNVATDQRFGRGVFVGRNDGNTDPTYQFDAGAVCVGRNDIIIPNQRNQCGHRGLCMGRHYGGNLGTELRRRSCSWERG